MELSREHNDPDSMAMALVVLGHTSVGRRAYPDARRYYEESLSILGKTGRTFAIGRLNSHLGDVALATGAYEEARAHHQAALSRYQDMGIYWQQEHPQIGGCYGMPVSWQRLGHVALAQGDFVEASRCYRQALLAAAEQSETGLELHLLLGPARWLARQGRVALAVELCALVLHRPDSSVETRVAMEALSEELCPQLTPDTYAAAQARGQARDLQSTLRDLLVELGPETTASTGGHSDA
jgi:tetratricopeptide (TPR) repeat protein